MTTCNHTLANGEPCNAPALNNCTACRHHSPDRQHTSAQPRLRESQPLQLPPLVSKNNVFCAISEVIHAVSERRIKRSVGGTLLFGLQMASKLMTEIDRMPNTEEQYGSSTAQSVDSPESMEKLEQRRARLAAAGDNSYVPTQEDMKGFMTNFECANPKKLVERIAAKRNAWEKQKAMSLASRLPDQDQQRRDSSQAQ